ncbi:MAG TPA: hypothetical protein ENJ09_14130 [Planctomycetes bacterium]|nr:hypothetical protein [Planctomycetota bacterium]
MKSIETEIQARVEAFVGDLTEMIRAAALEAVREALLGEAPAAPRRKPGRPAGKKKAKVTKAKSSAAPKRARKGKRVRRTAAQVEALKDKILAHVKAHPGQRLGEIAKALGLVTKDARRPAFLLVEDKMLKTTGTRGGTRYFAGGAKAAPAKKTTKRKSKKRKSKK